MVTQRITDFLFFILLIFIKDAIFALLCDPFYFGIAHEYNVKCKRNIYLKYSTRSSGIFAVGSQGLISSEFKQLDFFFEQC